MEQIMVTHTTGTRQEWLAARLELLEAEKELTRRSDALALRRRQLPWVRIDKEYRFDGADGPLSLADLFGGRSQLMVYHFMFGPDYTAGCPSCSAIADGFNDSVVHLANHDVTLAAVSRAPIEALLGYERRMGWSFPWVSSGRSDFNYDFNVATAAHDHEPTEAGVSEPAGDFVAALATSCGIDASTYTLDSPGLSTFALEDGVVYHTYSTYTRGLDVLWPMYQWLDRAPNGRNDSQTGPWWRRHDEYATH
jgi:predicted dithiol-disulfide oxidoreductase (DUF899 family)